MENLDKIFEIARLIAKEKTDKLSASENKQLQTWLVENGRNKEIYRKLQDGEKLNKELNKLKKFDEQKAFKKIEEKILKERKQLKVFRFVPNFIKYAAAVAVLVACSYLIFTKTNTRQIVQYTQNTILPGKQKATLITTKNQEIVLSGSDSVQIIKEELTDIIISGSSLTYHYGESHDKTKNLVAYNTLITPRGGEFTLFLSDSTEVILNSGSKLKYPVVFDKNIREVVLEGEAFFKVKKSWKSPFIVKTNDMNITVYGTVFNVSAYDAESYIQTTLVEGKVGISLNSRLSEPEIKLTPGQQLTYSKGTNYTEKTDVDTRQFTAWTEGKFAFENEPIENILNVMSRWYDFTFKFKDENLKKQRFTLNLGRDEDVKKILDMISISSNIKFLIEGNSIAVFSE